MKKLLWITALLMVLALVFAGCPTESKEKEKEQEQTPAIDLMEIFTATEATQGEITVTVDADSISFSGTSAETVQGKLSAPAGNPFDASAYKGFRFEYKSTGNWQIIILNDLTGGGDAGAWIYKNNNSNGWGSISNASNWTELEVNFTSPGFGKAWGEGSAFNKALIYEILFQVTGAATNKQFELRNFKMFE
ncbi:MAG: hypothetical protein LBH97_00340 [Treponema sp.]|nr:hypothetical protein [Treponema sp.]